MTLKQSFEVSLKAEMDRCQSSHMISIAYAEGLLYAWELWTDSTERAELVRELREPTVKKDGAE